MLLSVEPPLEVILTGPRMRGIPLPADESIEALPGWQRTSAIGASGGMVIYQEPVPGPEGNHARAFLETWRPINLRAALTHYGVRPYAEWASRAWSLGVILNGETLYIAYGSPDVKQRVADGLAQHGWLPVDQEAAEEVADRIGFGFRVRVGFSNVPADAT